MKNTLERFFIYFGTSIAQKLYLLKNYMQKNRDKSVLAFISSSIPLTL